MARINRKRLGYIQQNMGAIMTQAKVQEYLDTVWEALHDWEDIACPDRKTFDDVCYAMAKIREALDLPDEADHDNE